MVSAMAARLGALALEAADELGSEMLGVWPSRRCRSQHLATAGDAGHHRLTASAIGLFRVSAAGT